MPPAAPRKQGTQAYTCEILLQSMRNCLVNLPSALVSVLDDNNKVAQNVIVELTFLQSQTSQSATGKNDRKPIQRSVYVGWTGFQSKKKLTPLVGGDFSSQRSASSTSREVETPVIEIDSTFGKLLGLADGLKVGVFLHPDPAQAHTIHIEPLSPADWEIIELHANFLEINLLSQIRALPNPTFKAAGNLITHPLTLHLSPTSTANIVVTTLTPPPPNTSPFAKIAPDAEVIVAPKTRNKPVSSGKSGDSRSGRSNDARSTASPAKPRTRRAEVSSRSPVFLRGVDRKISDKWFDAEEDTDRDEGLRVWVDWSVLTSRELKRVTWALVSIVRPSGLQPQTEPDKAQDQDTVKPATRVVAQVFPWEDAPDSHHIALSSQLCAVLDASYMAGETIRLEPAPSQASRQAVKSLKVVPFISKVDKHATGLQFGGKSKTDREEASRKVLNLHGRMGSTKLLDGPITDGMILPPISGQNEGIKWDGGILKFDPPSDRGGDGSRSTRAWILASDRKLEPKSFAEDNEASLGSRLTLEVLSDGLNLNTSANRWSIGEPTPMTAPSLPGMEQLVAQLVGHVEHESSILLTGGRGAGKSSIAQFLAHYFRLSDLFSTIYFRCGKFSSDEMRVSSIKEELSRIFRLAAWGARFGGHTLIVLDDLDSICPAETELQVGNDNGRSKHISEILTTLAKQYSFVGSRIVVLATAKSKEDVNNIVIGGHVAREIVNIPAPDKDTRRIILESLVSTLPPASNNPTKLESEVRSESSSSEDSPSSERSPTATASIDQISDETLLKRSPLWDGFTVDPSIDFLDLGGRTDGFMPGDLLLLTSRARSEALIRTVSDTPRDTAQLVLLPADFDTALIGYTPSSLRNVTLQHSSTTFSSIGGLHSTRQTLLETLQYPTLYAPIFSRCPLRLRSGLLLYGYPGCGKTLLASAVAGECGLNFISVKGPEILNKYIGASEKSVRDLFERAQAARPCVLFFDEFDSIAPKRGHDSTGVTDRVVNQLLTQMDGAEGLSGVYVLAATSRPDLIDPALLRPGRLDKSLLCDMPNLDDRLDILLSLSQKLKVSSSVLAKNSEAGSKNLLGLANKTEGYSGADLQAVIYNAHLEAIHDLLGDRSKRSPKMDRQANQALASSSNKNLPDFSYFRLGDKAKDEELAMSAAVRATERSQIASQLVAHRTYQIRAKANRRLSVSDGLSNYDGNCQDKNEDREPIIHWDHIERSLAQTRPSISKEERTRLAGIYREFVVGRNGEMPSGQGGSQVGGRSTLW